MTTKGKASWIPLAGPAGIEAALAGGKRPVLGEGDIQDDRDDEKDERRHPESTAAEHGPPGAASGFFQASRVSSTV